MTPEQRARLEATRTRLDELDAALVALLAERSALVSALWAWKREQGVAQTDAGRETAVFARWRAAALAHGLDEAAIEQVARAIVGQSLR